MSCSALLAALKVLWWHLKKMFYGGSAFLGYGLFMQSPRIFVYAAYFVFKDAEVK
jgi:hypothetical protein